MELIALVVFWVGAFELVRFYHAPGVRLQLAQTIQLTSYWASAVLSVALVAGLVAARYRRRTPSAEKLVS